MKLDESEKSGEEADSEQNHSEKTEEIQTKTDLDEAEEVEEPSRVGYCLNLDPATKLMPFGASIDIRDTVDYKVRKTKKNYVKLEDSLLFSVNV